MMKSCKKTISYKPLRVATQLHCSYLVSYTVHVEILAWSKLWRLAIIGQNCQRLIIITYALQCAFVAKCMALLWYLKRTDKTLGETKIYVAENVIRVPASISERSEENCGRQS